MKTSKCCGAQVELSLNRNDDMVYFCDNCNRECSVVSKKVVTESIGVAVRDILSEFYENLSGVQYMTSKYNTSTEVYDEAVEKLLEAFGVTPKK